MSDMLLIFASDIPAAFEQWYEDEHIPEMASPHSQSVLVGEMAGLPIEKELQRGGRKDEPCKFLAMYEKGDQKKITDATHNEINRLPTGGRLQDSKFDIRSYEEIRRWQNESWNGGLSTQLSMRTWVLWRTDNRTDSTDVASVLVFEWQPRAGYEKEVLDFYQNAIGPMFGMAPEFARLRWFKIKSATVLKAGSSEALKNEDVYIYMSLAEINCDDWPWGEIFALNNLSGWGELFEDQKGVVGLSIHFLQSIYVLTRDRSGRLAIIG